ncbi:hypothetical protein, partial [Propionibacterium freudenreichii]|uniref:hypothetical protein n=1 Tax=Propionibacterium freudenreichii TaxID=1744 RepID=UPI003852CF89
AEVLASLQPATAQAPLPVVVEPLDPVHADRKLVRQVLVNLVGNALKFSARAAQPQVRLGMASAVQGGPLFCVRDNG